MWHCTCAVTSGDDGDNGRNDTVPMPGYSPLYVFTNVGRVSLGGGTSLIRP